MKTQIIGTPEVDEKLWKEAAKLATKFGDCIPPFFKERGDTEFSSELVTRALGMLLSVDRTCPFEHQLMVLIRARSVTSVDLGGTDATQATPTVPQ